MNYSIAVVCLFSLFLPLAGMAEDPGREDFEEARRERVHPKPVYEEQGKEDWVRSRESWTADREELREDKYDDQDEGRQDFNQERQRDDQWYEQ